MQPVRFISCHLHVLTMFDKGCYIQVHNWIDLQAENWNGRLAMVGFTGLLITEALSGKTIPEFYGLPHGGI